MRRAVLADQADCLETLAELASAYESAHLENIGMTATEWGKLIGIDRSTASRRLRGGRKFNTGHIRKAAEALNLEAALLIQLGQHRTHHESHPTFFS